MKKKLNNSHCYGEEWYLECENKYNDHGEVIENDDFSYKIKYKELKKVIYGHVWCHMVTNIDITVTCCVIKLT